MKLFRLVVELALEFRGPEAPRLRYRIQPPKTHQELIVFCMSAYPNLPPNNGQLQAEKRGPSPAPECQL